MNMYVKKNSIFFLTSPLRGGVTKKNGKIWEKFPNGGRVEKTDGNSQFQFGNCENPGGGLDFLKMSDFKC